MPLYTYKARNIETKAEVAGEREAHDKFEIYKVLKEEGLEVVLVKEKKSSNFSMSLPSFLNKVKTPEKIAFARNLGSMIEAGLSVSRALSVLERQTSNKKLQTVITDLITRISQGTTFSDAMAAHPKVFSHLFISMVKAGEQSGTLAQAFKLVALQMDRMYTLQRKVRGALMYPGIIFSVMIIIGVLMLTYIVPTLTKTFIELKVELPASTKFIIFVSDLFRNHGILTLFVCIAFAGLVYSWTRTLQGKKFFDWVFLKIPVIGEIVREVNTARTARTLSSLLTSGVDVVESVRITGDVLQNYHYKKVLEETGEKIKKGSPMSEFFISHKEIYPVFLGEMMSVGEETGKMGEMLLGVAKYYEEDVEQRTKDMSTIIEPFLMVIIGAAVGFFALSMISPMYSLTSAI